MADVKINELNEIIDVDSEDLLVILDEDENETMKVKVQDLVGSGGGGGSWGSITGNIQDQTDLMELIGDIGEALDIINGEEI